MFPPLPGSIAHTISQLPNQIRRREKLWEISKIKKVYAFDLPFLKSIAALVSSSNQINGKNSQILLFFEISNILLLFEKYAVIYHFFKLKFDIKFKFKKIKYHTKCHTKLDYVELEFLATC